MSAPAEPIATPMVQVVAPSTLPEGYVFTASHNGVSFPVEVPPGGVKQGTTFSAPFVQAPLGEGTALLGGSNATIIQGRFKDGMFDCCRLGLCHPSLCMAMFCPQILMGQVLQASKMTWLGDSSSDYQSTFRHVVFIVVLYWMATMFLAPVDQDDRTTSSSLHALLNGVFGLYSFIVMVKLRYTIRQRHKISSHCCGVAEDCCCVFFCSCLTISQLARHVNDYDTYRAECCSETGLPVSAEPMSLTTAVVV